MKHSQDNQEVGIPFWILLKQKYPVGYNVGNFYSEYFFQRLSNCRFVLVEDRRTKIKSIQL